MKRILSGLFASLLLISIFAIPVAGAKENPGTPALLIELADSMVFCTLDKAMTIDELRGLLEKIATSSEENPSAEEMLFMPVSMRESQGRIFVDKKTPVAMRIRYQHLELAENTMDVIWDIPQSLDMLRLSLAQRIEGFGDSQDYTIELTLETPEIQ